MHKLIIFFFLFEINSFQKETVNSVELSYQTRGTQKNLLITPDRTVVIINGEEVQSIKTTSAQWKKVAFALSKVNLVGLSTLKRPTNKSAHDGAFITKVKVATFVKEYESSTFDHTAPPTQLVELIKTMKSTLASGDYKAEF
jgi:type IV secretory pathway TrbD component